MPICAFDIHSDGRARPVTDASPEPVPDAGALFRWLHFDLGDPLLPGWAETRLPELAARSLLQQETRPRCDPYGDGLILNLRGVNLNPDGPVDQMVSLRMWVTPRTIVTVRLRKIFALDDIRIGCLKDEAPGSVPDFLAQLVQGLALRARDTVLEIDRQTEALEERFEDESDDNDAAPLRAARRTVIRLRRYLAPQREALARLLTLDSPVFAQAERANLREAVNLAAVSSESLESLAARLSALQDFADARTARRLGRNSYALSVVAAVFLPLSFFTGLFGVNIAGMPGLDWAGAFALLTGALVALGIGTFLVLKWLRLL